MHILKHSGARPYSCSLCNKSFMDQPTCRKHERTHDDVKPFLCGFCGKSFRMAWSMRKHEVKVHGRGSQPAESEEANHENSNEDKNTQPSTP